MSRSRQRDVNVDGALPRNQARGCGRDRVHDDERVHPAAMGGRRRAGSRRVGRCSWPEVRIRNRKTPKRTNRATSRRSRYSERRLRLGRAAEPGEALDGAAPGGGQRLRRDPARRRAARASSLADVRVATSGAGRVAGRVRGGFGVGVASIGSTPSAGVVAVGRARPRRRLGVVVGRSSSSSYSSSSIVVDVRRRSTAARPAARSRPTSRPRDASAGRRAGGPGGGARPGSASAGTMNSSDTICAVGTPKNVQLSCAERLERRSGRRRTR